MSRIFLISLNTCHHPCEVYPIGMAVVAAALQRDRHEVSMYDYLAAGKNEADLIISVKEYKPEFIGISIRNIDDNVDSSFQKNNTKKFTWISNIIKKIKEATSAPVIIGGSAFSLMPEAILKITKADYGVVGEGEKAICRLITDLNEHGKADRIIYGSDFSIIGSEIKGGLYNEDLVYYYYDRTDFIGIQTKRGCPFHCNYCTYPILEGHYFRYRENEDIINEIIQLKTEFGCNCFFFTDSIFNDPAGHYKELLEEIIIKEIDIKWTAYFTPYLLESSDIELCKRAGLFAAELGTDAASTTTLTGLNKMFNWDDVVKANSIITNAGIPCAHSIIFGGPDETDETLIEGIENCQKLENCVVFGYAGVRIYPGALLMERALSEGIVEENSFLLEPIYYFSPAIDKQRMCEMICQGWKENKCLIFPAKKGKKISQALKRMCNAKGLLWDKMLHLQQTKL
jgi:radical SAM superfamily enzyme YgiQ (UPF0313 family)